MVEKRGDNNQTVFRLQISTDSIRIHYLTGSDGVQSINFAENYIPTHTWSHIALQVCAAINVVIDIVCSLSQCLSPIVWDRDTAQCQEKALEAAV